MISSTKCRPFILLFLSVIFYIWGSSKGIVIITVSAFANYVFGFFIARTKARRKKWITGIAVVFNLSLLIYFKYTDFLLGIVNRIQGGNLEITFLKFMVPFGISYFSFSAISYLIDIYRGDVVYERNFLCFFLYMIMFPKITAGPIVRYKDISGQLDSKMVSLSKSTEGAERFCIGLAKKVLIADQLGLIADDIFSFSPSGLLTSTAWLGAVCYTLQIYYDFSGYSDMAVGIGKICGFDFQENFDHPYISRSLTEFWRRWHISLSSWFRDYLYIPLGGSRRGNVYLNIFIVFLATGIWHGGEWHFVIWGIWNGIFLILEKFLKKHCRISLPAWLQHIYTLSVVMLGWVLFRSGSMTMAVQYFKKLLGIGSPAAGFTLRWYLSPKIIGILILGGFGCIPWDTVKKKSSEHKTLEYTLCIGLLLISIAVVMSSTQHSFIYFKF